MFGTGCVVRRGRFFFFDVAAFQMGGVEEAESRALKTLRGGHQILKYRTFRSSATKIGAKIDV